MDTTILTNLDTLIARNLCIGYVAENQAGDTIIDIPAYGVGMSSFPQVNIDAYNNIYFLWSSVTVGNASPDPYNYRHIWGRAWFNGKPVWSEMKDFNAGLLYVYQEFVYPAVAKNIKNGNLQMITQTSTQPGSHVKDSDVPEHAVDIQYREIPTSEFIATGYNSNQNVVTTTVTGNYPNPVKGSTSFKITMGSPSTVTIDVCNIMGQKMMRVDKGVMNAGIHSIAMDCRTLTPGIYFYTVKINGDSFTHKMIVE